MKIRTDHETVTPEGLTERVKRGFYVHVRQGTVTKNLEALLPAINYKNADRICFCTDDKHLDELIDAGGVDDVVRQAIALGLEPTFAFSIATKNPAACYGLKDKGAVAPGYTADIVIWDKDFKADYVFKAARLVAKHGETINKKNGTVAVPGKLTRTVKPAPIKKEDFALALIAKTKLNVIGVSAGNVITEHKVVEIEPAQYFLADPKRDLAKLAVIERHHATGNIAVCAVNGFGIKNGAIASTVAHDSHNIIAVGTNDFDILCAVNALIDMQGGYVVARDNQILAAVKLEVAGLMTQTAPDKLLSDLKKLHDAAGQILEKNDFNPFQMLSFISLPVIPYLKLTDMGLVDVMKFSFIPPAE